jgi:hypothetical protein
VTVLLDASWAAAPSDSTPVVLADAGVENVNAHVDALIEPGAWVDVRIAHAVFVHAVYGVASGNPPMMPAQAASHRGQYIRSANTPTGQRHLASQGGPRPELDDGPA